MSVEVKSVGRTRIVHAHIYLEFWVQIDAGTLLIYGDGDSTNGTTRGYLDILDAQCDTLTRTSAGKVWYGAPEPDLCDPGETNKAWFGQAVWIEFNRTQASGEWHTLAADIRSFVETAFPGELIFESWQNRRFERPAPTTDPDPPARYILWMIDYTAR